MPAYTQDLRFGLRRLGRAPGFVLLLVLTLAVGVGLNAAIFTVVDCVLLRPLGYRDADRIIALRSHMDDENVSYSGIGGGDYTDMVQGVPGLESTAFYNTGSAGARLRNDSVFEQIATVSPRFTDVLGVKPVAGRTFRSEEDRGTEALISETLAREHFGSPAAALGQVVQTGPLTRVVVGVLPAAFSFPSGTRLWLETDARPKNLNRTAYNQRAIGKRRRDVSPQQLDAQLLTFSRHLQSSFPEDKHKRIEAVPLQEQLVGRIRPTLRLLMGSVALVLLIVCTNIAHLQIVRATARLRGVSIQTALGASRATLAREALVEALLLACIGAVAAFAFAAGALKLLLRLAPASIPRLGDIHLNTNVLLFSLALSIGLMLITAILPIARFWIADPAAALRNDASRGMEARGSRRLQNALLITEIAFTLQLSVGAVLFARELVAQSHANLGFTADHLLILDSHVTATDSVPDVPDTASPADKAAARAAQIQAARAQLAKLDALQRTVAEAPGVSTADAIVGAPMGFNGSDVGYAIRGRQVFDPGVNRLPYADIRPVTPGFFSTMKIPVLRGRAVSSEDRLLGPSVVLINAALARQQFPGQDPIGKQIMCGYDVDSSWWTIVGVVGDVRADSPGTNPSPTLYVPIAQHPNSAGDLQLVARTQSDPVALGQTLMQRLKSEHPDVAVSLSTMTANIAETQRLDRFRTALFCSFAAVALFLAGVGMYGITTYSVHQRTFEFGLRLAVGASRPQLLAMVLRGALTSVLLGTAAGFVLSLASVRALSSVLGKLPSFDPAAYSLAAFAVISLGAVAALIPAQKASTVEPMQVLRSE